MFELETYVLDEKQFTRTVTWNLHGLRAICYGFIIWLVAFVFIELNNYEWRMEDELAAAEIAVWLSFAPGSL